MAEYIEREAALQIIDYAKQLTSEQIVRESGTYELLSDTGKACYDGIITAFAMCKRLINEAVIAADAQPVKHGYWIKQPEKFQIYEDVINSNYLYSCSYCNASDLHSERANNDGEIKFCWRCGARMDAEPDEPWQSD